MSAGDRDRRDAVLNVRIPEQLKESLRLAAARDHGRSMSNMLVRILEEWFEQNAHAARPTRRARKKKSGTREVK